MIGRPGTKRFVVVRLAEGIYDWTADSDRKGTRLAHFAAGFRREPTKAREYSDAWLAHMRGGLFRKRLDSGELVVCADLLIRLKSAIGDRSNDLAPITATSTSVPWANSETADLYAAEYADAHR